MFKTISVLQKINYFLYKQRYYNMNQKKEKYRYLQIGDQLIQVEDPKRIAQMLFHDFEYPTFIWVGGTDDPQIVQNKNQVAKSLRLNIQHLPSFQSFKEFLQTSKCHNLIAIFMIQMYKEAINIHLDVSRLFFYTKDKDYYENYMVLLQKSDDDSGDGSKSFQQEENQAKDWKSQVFMDSFELQTKLRQNLKGNHTPKLFRNFTFLESQPKVSQIIAQTKISNLILPQTKNNTQEVISYIQEVFQELKKKKDTWNNWKNSNDFFDFLRESLNLPVDLKQKIQNGKVLPECTNKILNEAIGYYTQSTPIHEITNKILLYHAHPSISKFLFIYNTALDTAIYRLFRQQIDELRKVQKCYRGGRMDKSQFQMFEKNKNKIIQNKAYLSTSVKRETAQNFLKKGNTLFQILLDSDQIFLSAAGFCLVKQLSCFDESQLIFNTSNCFQILKCQIGEDGKHFIQLKYRQLKEADRCEEQKKQRQLLKLQRSKQYQILCQGNALTNQFYQLEGGQQYWSKYIMITKQKLANQQLSQNQQAHLVLKIAFALLCKNLFSLRNSPFIEFEYQYMQLMQTLLKLFGNGNDQHVYQGQDKDKDGDRIYQKIEKTIEKKLVSYQDKERLKEFRVKKLACEPLVKISQIKQTKQYKYFKNFEVESDKNLYLITDILHRDNQKFDKNNEKDFKDIFRENIKQLILTRNQLAQFPICIKDQPLIFQQVQTIDLSSNYISTLHNSLQKFSSLSSINLSKNSLVKIPEFFSRLGLKYLNISRNQLKSLPDNFFTLIKLVDLNLSHNYLQTLPIGSSNLRQLEVFNLSKNQFQTLPSQVFKVKKLVNLDLSNNKLLQIPPGLWDLKQIRYINLNYNQFERLPQKFQDFQILMKLNISKNKLTELPKAFLCSSKNIKQLNLSDNKIKEESKILIKMNLPFLNILNLSTNLYQKIPSFIFDLTQLIQFDISNNFLDCVNDEIGNLTKLKKLKLTKNQLKQINIKIFGLKLQEFQMAENKLKKVPSQIQNLTTLHILDFSNNKISELPQSISSLQNLENFYIFNNELKSFPKSIKNLRKLKRINASWNELSDLPQEICNLVNVELLNFSNNKLQAFPSVQNLTNLSSLNLSSNLLTTYPRGMEKLSKKLTLNLQKNRINIRKQTSLSMKALDK